MHVCILGMGSHTHILTTPCTAPDSCAAPGYRYRILAAHCTWQRDKSRARSVRSLGVVRAEVFWCIAISITTATMPSCIDYIDTLLGPLYHKYHTWRWQLALASRGCLTAGARAGHDRARFAASAPPAAAGAAAVAKVTVTVAAAATSGAMAVVGAEKAHAEREAAEKSRMRPAPVRAVRSGSPCSMPERRGEELGGIHVCSLSEKRRTVVLHLVCIGKKQPTKSKQRRPDPPFIRWGES